MAYGVRPAMNRDAARLAFQGLQQKRESAPLSPVGSPSRMRSLGAPRIAPGPQMQQAPAPSAPQAPQQQQQGGPSMQGAGPQPPSTGGQVYFTQGKTPLSTNTGESTGKGTSTTSTQPSQLPGTKPPTSFDKPTLPNAGYTDPASTKNTPLSLEQLYEQSIREMLDYKRDPAAEEALIREAIEGKTGAELNDARAGMGRAGFGGSGAGQALEGDIMREAGLASQQAILDARRTSDMDRLGALGSGLDAANRQRELAIQEKAFEMALQMLSDGEGGGGAGGGGGGLPPVEGKGGIIDKATDPILDILQPGHDQERIDPGDPKPYEPEDNYGQPIGTLDWSAYEQERKENAKKRAIDRIRARMGA